MEIKTIYGDVKKLLSIENLHKMTTKLLDIKKSGKHSELKNIYEKIFNENVSGNNENIYFIKLIKYFHPDRFNFLVNEIESAYKEESIDKLQFYKKILNANFENKRLTNIKYEHSERYEYDINDFEDSFYAEPEDTQEYYDYSINEEDENLDFVRAVKSAYLGNANYNFTRSDLSNLTGELNLTSFGLSDLDGAEECVYISSLNLSDNEISNLYDLQTLHNLKELYLSMNNITNIEDLLELHNLEILDLSDNDIEDFSPLLKLESLKFVNIENNPGIDMEIIEALEKEAIVVLY